MVYLFLVLIVFAAAYLSWRIVQTRPGADGGDAPTQRPPAPRGPDDDPDFLRSLDNH
ncbi:hypothetical protein [Gordonia hydrophobica]|uniref:Uncharacterized protein n=1 Tax=Gordonia hydrophobica TaxID=40516 RepID=A0ABZ2TZ35_9ACTN|nr:hypothetical protein [Gordonia hydrophobica]MBM7365967.1 hypothetical protein [Gordonia hydrophobica]